MTRRITIASACLLLSTLLVACATKTTPTTLPPGAINTFDADSYVSLMGAQAVLSSVKADIGKLPPSAKPALNKAIASYNIAEAAWQAYHSGANGDTATLTKAITQATVDVAALLTQISGGH